MRTSIKVILMVERFLCQGFTLCGINLYLSKILFSFRSTSFFTPESVALNSIQTLLDENEENKLLISSGHQQSLSYNFHNRNKIKKKWITHSSTTLIALPHLELYQLLMSSNNSTKLID